MTPTRSSAAKTGASKAQTAKVLNTKTPGTKTPPAAATAKKTTKGPTASVTKTQTSGAAKTIGKSTNAAKSASRSGTKSGESLPKRPVKAAKDQTATTKPVSKAAKVTKAVAAKPAPAKAVADTAAKKSAAKVSATAKAESKPVSSVTKGRSTAAAKATPDPAKATKSPTSKAAVAVKEPSDVTKETPAPATKVPRSVKTPAKSVPATSPKGSPGPYASEEKFLEEQRKMLLEERETYVGQMTDLRAEAESLALEREPGDVQFDEESGEGGTVAVDRERDLTLAAQAQATIAQIDVALGAIADKTYGVCENCRQAIPKARLRALPYVRLCMACKSGGLHRR